MGNLRTKHICTGCTKYIPLHCLLIYENKLLVSRAVDKRSMKFALNDLEAWGPSGCRGILQYLRHIWKTKGYPFIYLRLVEKDKI